jgi:hypothetical protein
MIVGQTEFADETLAQHSVAERFASSSRSLSTECALFDCASLSAGRLNRRQNRCSTQSLCEGTKSGLFDQLPITSSFGRVTIRLELRHEQVE